jgi:hypothetical protein
MAGSEVEDTIDKNRTTVWRGDISNPAGEGARAGRRMYKACWDAARDPSDAFSGVG